MVPFTVCSVKDHQGQYNAYENVWYNRCFYYVTSIDAIKGKWRPEPWNNGEEKEPFIMLLFSHLGVTPFGSHAAETSIWTF